MPGSLPWPNPQGAQLDADRQLRLARHQRVGFAQGEAGADDGVFGGAGLVFDVGGGHDGAVGQEFHAGIAAIAARIAVQEFDAVLAGFNVPDVVIGAHPGDEMALGGALRGLIAEGDDVPHQDRGSRSDGQQFTLFSTTLTV